MFYCYFLFYNALWKDSDAGRDWGQEEKGTTEDEMAGWHHRLNGHEFEWTSGVGDGQGGLVCCDSWGRKESDTTEWLNWLTDWCDFYVQVSYHKHKALTHIISGSVSSVTRNDQIFPSQYSFHVRCWHITFHKIPSASQFKMLVDTVELEGERKTSIPVNWWISYI